MSGLTLETGANLSDVFMILSQFWQQFWWLIALGLAIYCIPIIVESIRIATLPIDKLAKEYKDDQYWKGTEYKRPSTWRWWKWYKY